MKGDFTRSSFERTKNYSSVRLQQGRVMTDADCNESEDIGLARERQLAADVIGHAAGPAGATGYEISLGSQNPRELMLSPGRYYVQGLLCELHEATPLSNQPALAGVDPTRNLPPGQYLLYLQAFERHVTHIDDASIKEVALGGPDTSTRLQVVAQARLKRLRARPAPTVCELMSDSDTLASWIEGRRGRMAASVDPAPPVVDPCLVPSTAGYRGLENQLYRVEIHRGSKEGMATFKWSRENACVAAEWTRHPDSDQVEVADFGPAGRGLNEPGVLVELLDSGDELTQRPGTLATVVEADEASRILTLKEPRDEEGNPVPLERGRDELHPRVRRWEGTEARRVDAADTDDGWIDLEQGVRIRFEHANRTFRTGDYWLIPARTVEGAITWNPAGLQEPHGIQQRYACLAVLERSEDDGPFTLQRRCQRQFPSVRELIHLRYVGGDGQRGRLGELLTYPLRVQVLNGGVPVAGAAVRFEVVDASGVSDAVLNDLPATTSGNALTLRTDTDGTVDVGWTLASEAAWTQAPQLSVQQVRATLLDECGEGTPQSVEFTASESSGTLQNQQGCCTIRLTPADLLQRTLQNIIDLAVTDTQGAVVVCFGPGRYELQAPLRLDARHQGLVLEGCGGAVVIAAAADAVVRFVGGLVVLSSSNGVTFCGLQFSLPLVPFDFGRLQVDEGLRRRLRGELTRPVYVCTGLQAIAVNDLHIDDCDFHFPRVPIGATLIAAGLKLVGGAMAIQVERSRFDVPGQSADGEWEYSRLCCGIFGASSLNIEPQSPATGQLSRVQAVVGLIDGISIRGCRYEGCFTALWLGGRLGDLRIDDNTVRGSALGLILVNGAPRMTSATLDGDSNAASPASSETPWWRVFAAAQRDLLRNGSVVLAETLQRMASPLGDLGVEPLAFPFDREEVDQAEGAAWKGIVGAVSAETRPTSSQTEPSERPTMGAESVTILPPDLSRDLADTLARLDRALEMRDRQQLTPLRIHAAGNDIVTLGGAFWLLNEFGVPTSEIVIQGNRLTTSEFRLPAFLAVFVRRCSVTGNVIINKAPDQFVPVSDGEPVPMQAFAATVMEGAAQRSSVAVVGNTFVGWYWLPRRTEFSFPLNVWYPMNSGWFFPLFLPGLP